MYFVNGHWHEGVCTDSKEVRRERAQKAAEEYQVRTGEGPGRRGYIDAYFYAYFAEPQSSSRGIEGVVIEQFEELLDTLAASGTFVLKKQICTSPIPAHGSP